MKSKLMFVSLLVLLLSLVYNGSIMKAGTQPILHYTFDEGFQDVTGNGFDGEPVGDVYVDGGLLWLDGDDDAVEIPSMGVVYEFTYAFWVNSDMELEATQFSGGINTNEWAAGSVHFKLNYGLMNVGINGYGDDVVGTNLVYAGEWTHMALTVSETEVTHYLNGVFEAMGEIETPQELIMGDATLGAWNLDREWFGSMDDVRIYDVALSESEIDSLAKIPPGMSAVAQKTDNFPAEFNLLQNYPNPFNPSTTISYTLKTSGNVKLSVYDLTGHEVAILVDGIQSAGNHDVQFDGANLTSGIYFYKLQTADQIFTRKMTLVK